MKIYKIYSARLEYGKYNRYKGTVNAENLNEVKQLIKKTLPEGGFLLNPFYAVIVDITDGKKEIVYNQHLSLCEE
jgi:hypothetical protein